MKKSIRFIVVIFLSLTILSSSAYAADIEEKILDISGANELSENLPESASEFENINILDALNIEEWIVKIKDKGKDLFFSVFSEGIKNAGGIFIIAVLCGVFESLKPDKEGFDYISLIAVIGISAITTSQLGGFLNETYVAVDEMNMFSKAVLPTISAAAASGGAVSSAAVKYSICALFMEISLKISKNVIFPLIFSSYALNLAGAAFGEGLSKLSKFLKFMVTLILTVMCLGFTAYLSISGVVAESADAVTAKAAKTVISSVLPVVGSMISDAASTVVSGISVVKNAVGIFGVFVVLSICLVPFTKLGVSYLIFKISAALASCVTDGKCVKTIEAAADVYALALGVVGADAIMLFFSLISMIKTVTL